MHERVSLSLKMSVYPRNFLLKYMWIGTWLFYNGILKNTLNTICNLQNKDLIWFDKYVYLICVHF